MRSYAYISSAAQKKIFSYILLTAVHEHMSYVQGCCTDILSAGMMNPIKVVKR